MYQENRDRENRFKLSYEFLGHQARFEDPLRAKLRSFRFPDSKHRQRYYNAPALARAFESSVGSTYWPYFENDLSCFSEEWPMAVFKLEIMDPEDPWKHHWVFYFCGGKVQEYYIPDHIPHFDPSAFREPNDLPFGRPPNAPQGAAVVGTAVAAPIGAAGCVPAEEEDDEETEYKKEWDKL